MNQPINLNSKVQGSRRGMRRQGAHEGDFAGVPIGTTQRPAFSIGIVFMPLSIGVGIGI